MKIDLSKLYILKEMIPVATDLSEPMLYFFDHFADFPIFKAMSTPVEDAFIMKFVELIGRKISKREKVVIKQEKFGMIPTHDFIHGGCLANNLLIIVAFFTDIQQGVFVVVVNDNPIYGRITTDPFGDIQEPHFIMPPDTAIN